MPKPVNNNRQGDQEGPVLLGATLPMLSSSQKEALQKAKLYATEHSQERPQQKANSTTTAGHGRT